MHDVFENVANTYDLMNDVMSFGVHRLWKQYFVSQLNLKPGMKILDMAGGTGVYFCFYVFFCFYVLFLFILVIVCCNST